MKIEILSLVLSPLDGEFVAFEVNPAPAYSWYQESTGQPIAEAIVDYLAHGEG